MRGAAQRGAQRDEDALADPNTRWYISEARESERVSFTVSLIVPNKKRSV
jgi:hypothetical protein